jgi:hypothetical protein
MAGKSSINRLPPQVKEYIQRLLREDRMTLDEMLTDLQERFPNQQAPSRSALGRYKTGFDSMAAKLREQQANAEALVGALGEDATDKTGVLLVQAISTLTYQATLDAHDKEEVEIADVLALARAAKATMDARTLSVKERQAIEHAAEQRLIKEQRAKLDELGRSGQIDQATLSKVIQAAYGL